MSLLEHDEVDAIIDVFNLPEEVDPGDTSEVDSCSNWTGHHNATTKCSREGHL